MNYRYFKLILIIFFIYGCDASVSKKINKSKITFDKRYNNAGFALVYNEKKDMKKLEERSLDIFHKSLKKRSKVKITNPVNGNFLIAEVKSNNVKFSNFYNSVLSNRIAETLELDLDEPFVELALISKDSTFVAKKTKTFDEERNVAEKAPVDGIQINDLNLKKNKKTKTQKKVFSYSIKIADFYFKDTAQIMRDRIINETTLKNFKIIKLSPTKYRLLIGPFNDIKTLKESFEKMNLFNFENLEIIKNV